MKAKPGNCHLVISGSDEVKICIENYNIKSNKCEKRLGIKIHKLNFCNHIDEICKNAGEKINELSRVNSYMDLAKRRMSLNAFFLSQFSYYQLVWMFHSGDKSNKINRLHANHLY